MGTAKKRAMIMSGTTWMGAPVLVTIVELVGLVGVELG